MPRHARRRKKKGGKFPAWLKLYHKCRASGKSKKVCKRLYYPKKR